MYLVRYGRDKPIETRIGNGDVVLVSRGDPLKSDLQATVVRVGNRYLDLAFATKPPKWSLKETVRVDLYVNDIAFKRMEHNLRRLPNLQGKQALIRDILLGLAAPRPQRRVSVDLCDAALNQSQRQAVLTALGSDDVALVHGPPGTGKTTTLIEIIRQHVHRDKRILATADSNVAVDNMLEKLTKYDTLRLVRIGHPVRVDAKLEDFTLAAQLERHPVQSRLQELRAILEQALRERDEHTKPTPGKLRGMSRSRIQTLAKQGRGMRGIDATTIASMAKWLEADAKVDTLFQTLHDEEQRAARSIIDRADVVLSTNAMVASDILEACTFDVAVIDEAAQQIEPSSLLPAMRASSIVLAGDHKQLPPTVISENDVLKRSLFERLMMRRDIPSTMLRIQYRMNETIMDFPNALMYEGALQASPDVAERILPCRCDDVDTQWQSVLDPNRPVVFVDTDCDACETLPPHSTSYINEKEADVCALLVENLLKTGVPSANIGIITPYNAQQRLIEKKLGGIPVECRSVDGFQGREKEVIVISFVRSNLARSIGFVGDARRLNVAMTRARSKLIMIGSQATLVANPPFDRLFTWFARHPNDTAVVSLSEELSQ